MFLKLPSYEQTWILIKSNLPTFKFSFNAFCDLFKKSLPTPTSRRQICMFCSRRFMTLGFTFRSMISLRLILCVCEVRVQVNFCLMLLQLFQGHLLKRLLYPHWTAWTLLSKINRVYMWGPISGFYSVLSICPPLENFGWVRIWVMIWLIF